MNSAAVTRILLFILLLYIIFLCISWFFPTPSCFECGTIQLSAAVAYPTVLLGFASGISVIELVYLHTKSLSMFRRSIMIIMASIIGVFLALFGMGSALAKFFSGVTL